MEDSGAPSSPTLEDLNAIFHFIGFEFEEMSAQKVSGRFIVSSKSGQVLLGGVSALVAESLASLGAHIASGYQRIAGIHLGVSHLRPADIGDMVTAEATPISVGKRIQVWEVRLWKTKATKEPKTLVSSARVTLLSNMPVAEHLKEGAEIMRKYAKL